MTGAELVVDDRELCCESWPGDGPADLHICERVPEHDGRHQCICGSWRTNAEA